MGSCNYRNIFPVLCEVLLSTRNYPSALSCQYSRIQSIAARADVEKIFRDLRRLFIEVQCTVSVYEMTREDTTSQDGSKRFKIECDGDVGLDMINDELNALGTAKEAINQEDSDCDDDEEKFSTQPLPSVATSMEIFRDIDSLAYGYDADGAIMHLCRARGSFLNKTRNEIAPERQLLIT